MGENNRKNEQNNIEIPNVSKVYEPEPDRIPIRYLDAKFTEIPEWLFSKKVTSTVISKFNESDAILTIPEGLFKNNINIKKFEKVFEQCRGITNIPEGLFKNNTEVTEFGYTFSACTGLTSIPEGLFKNNVNVTKFEGVFSACIGITDIPEGLFKNNVNVTSFAFIFAQCKKINNVPEKIIEAAKRVKDKGGSTAGMFRECEALPDGSLPNYIR